MEPHCATLRRITLHNLAGYRSVIWERLQPDLNFLLGRNGAGKTTVLQALSFALSSVSGVRTEDLLTKTYRDADIELELTTGETARVSFGAVRRSQGRPGLEPILDAKTLQIVENRQPKNTVGEDRSEFRAHHTRRYPNSITELKFLLGSNAADRSLAKEVLDICRRIGAVGSAEEWAWIEAELQRRGPTRARPVSCGQFDIVALVLDLVRLRNSVERPTQSAFVLIDNPETFLHPACQEPVLGLVREFVPQAQLFIASHSIKLLCHREPRSVFWLSRDRVALHGEVRISSLRELEEGGKAAFFELYGTDANSAVLSLLRPLDSPEYYKFLCDCALPPAPEARPNPAVDRQMREVRRQLEDHPDEWTVLDFGAGHGDLLAAFLQWGASDARTTYIASTRDESATLARRFKQALAGGRISPRSRLVGDLSEVNGEFDAVVLCNVCHEILPPELPRLLACILSRLRQSALSKLVIHEVETLPIGEADFVMWSPEDYQHIFAGVAGIGVEVSRNDLGGVPLATTVVRPPAGGLDPRMLETRLVEAFTRQLPIKREQCLSVLEQLSARAARAEGFNEAIRQRRVAFFTAQVATLCLLERRPLTQNDAR